MIIVADASVLVGELLRERGAAILTGDNGRSGLNALLPRRRVQPAAHWTSLDEPPLGFHDLRQLSGQRWRLCCSNELRNCSSRRTH